MTPRRWVLGAVGHALAPAITPAPPPNAPGLAVAGEFSRVCGLSEAAHLTLAGLRALGQAPRAVDVSWRGPGLGGEALAAGAPLILHVNAPGMPVALLRLGRAAARGRKIVGAWAWELELPPASWRAGARFAHEIWAPSRFAAAALERLAPGRVRVVTPPLAVMPPAPSALGRAGFGLPADAVVVLVSADLASSYARKNPLAAVAAFRAAFGERKDRVVLLKIGNPGHFPSDFAQIRAEIGAAPNIRLFTETLSRADHHALLACADIVLALHRSEGFGLVPAEAMLLGKPVIATGWSGNLDYMDADSAALIHPRLIPAVDPRGIYSVPGAVWAQPSLGGASAALITLANDPIRRRDLGGSGQAHAMARLGTESLARAMAGL